MSSLIWTAFMVTVLIVLSILLIKFLNIFSAGYKICQFCNCMLIRSGDDSTPILPGRREAFWIEYDRLRMEALWARQPPPAFEEALANSRPISYLDIEEEPPPTYSEFLKSQTPSPSSSNASPLAQGMDFEASSSNNVVINPFENDFVISDPNFQEESGTMEDLAGGVFGKTAKNQNQSRNRDEADRTESEA